MASHDIAETPRRIISSGNDELDSRIGGGLPSGSVTLIEGGSGSGKSVLAEQIVWGALRDGLRAAIFTSENTVKSLIRQMQRDRKSTRLNSSHVKSSYAVFCLKKKIR